MRAPGQPVRYFFALRPDTATAGELAALAAQLAHRHGGRALVAEDIHLTLAFIGRRARDDRERLAALLKGLPTQTGVDGAASPEATPDGTGPIRLERLGTFGHGLLWIGPPAAGRRGQDRNGAASPMASELRARLRTAGIGFDERPLVLHATLVRGAHGIPADPADCGGGRKIVVTRAGVTVEPAIIARAWAPALGFSGDRLPAGRRYRWSHPMPQCLS